MPTRWASGERDRHSCLHCCGESRVPHAHCVSSVVPVPVVQGVVRGPVVRNARAGQPDRVLNVVLIAVRCAECDSVLVWSVHARGNPTDRARSAHPAVATDRFAREIIRFLTRFAVRSRQLNGIPLGGTIEAFPHNPPSMWYISLSLGLVRSADLAFSAKRSIHAQ